MSNLGTKIWHALTVAPKAAAASTTLVTVRFLPLGWLVVNPSAPPTLSRVFPLGVLLVLVRLAPLREPAFLSRSLRRRSPICRQSSVFSRVSLKISLFRIQVVGLPWDPILVKTLVLYSILQNHLCS